MKRTVQKGQEENFFLKSSTLQEELIQVPSFTKEEVKAQDEKETNEREP